MRCAKGIFAKGILGCTRFPLLRWEKGSETPSCGGEKGLRLPRSSCSDLGTRESQTIFPPQEGVSDPFSHCKRENPVHPKIPLAKIPLAQHMKFVQQYLGVQKLTQSGLNGGLERDFWKTNLPFLRLIKALYLREENCLQNLYFCKQKSYLTYSPENFCGFYLRICLGILHWKMAGIFGEFFSGLRFPRSKAQKLLKYFGENSEQNSGWKFEKFGKLSFCNFSDLTKRACLKRPLKQDRVSFSTPEICPHPIPWRP